MVKEIQYTNIRRVLEDLQDHPMLRDLTLEQVVNHTIRFIARHGYNKLYQDKLEDVEIHEFRGLMPCDVISINQVKDLQSGICLRSMTDNFPTGLMPQPKGKPCKDPMNNQKPSWYIPERRELMEEPAFKTQGRVIFTTFPEGMVQVSYKGLPVDEDGFPLLIDNELYLDALELYIKKQVFTIKFDQGKIAAGVLQNTQTEYAVAARLLQSEFTIPSQSEMESIARMWNTMIPKVREFDNGFKHLGDREYLKNHNNIK